MSKEQLKKMAAVLLPYLLPALQEELDQRREEDREWSTVECARQLAEREQHRYDRTEDTVPVGFTSLAEMEEHMQCVARAVLAAEDERRRQRQVQEDARREERHTRQQEELRGELHRLKHSLMGEVEQRARAQEDTLTALQSQLTKLTRRQSTTKVIVDSNNNNNNVLLECQPLTAHVRRLLASHQQLIDVVVERRCAAVLEQVEGERHRYDLQNTDLRTRLQTLRNDTRHALTEMSRNLNIAAPGL
ncbi:hypothetical protein ADEAN_000924900 [Angomonas deanei]|uniref:Uncharacterized protein n=1 Tax=Angomonas deanei TaxID=59799 RepID=A0A7G2CRV7_9TRYP|nr:hypothetical protein ADEAN_000924900 [Angomonas deanei]